MIDRYLEKQAKIVRARLPGNSKICCNPCQCVIGVEIGLDGERKEYGMSDRAISRYCAGIQLSPNAKRDCILFGNITNDDLEPLVCEESAWERFI